MRVRRLVISLSISNQSINQSIIAHKIACDYTTSRSGERTGFGTLVMVIRIGESPLREASVPTVDVALAELLEISSRGYLEFDQA